MTTRALVVAPGDQMFRMCQRRDALSALGAAATSDWEWYVWATTTSAWSKRDGRMLLAVDPWCSDEDWESCVNLLRLAGWFTGDRLADDIGEPLDDRQHDVWVWDLIRT